ncbi:GNAT family N-acetyltransferase [Methanococcus voltae]|uniref:GCN5-related N-acetyltransferase n=1 Tax=Methanococcus voltae (strain ATCC BAA-1334 / A3) TaxID=456320 RepID=D7DU48_METV3|nr:N-acetyltransferase [Methanococcus voltae]MCS3900458.1 ribosomal-protein-alanine N-acetyltransferase [Methanococcus voltae]
MVEEDLIIRTANINDISQIMNLEIKSFDKGVRETEITYSNRLDVFKDGFLVLEHNNSNNSNNSNNINNNENKDEKNIIGFITSELWENVKENTEYCQKFNLNHNINKFHNDNGKELYISSIAISKNHQHKGYGNLLFNTLIDNMISKYNIKSIILIVSENWTNAIKLYTHNGFKEIYRINEFFNCNKGKFDGIIMKKELYSK